MAQINEAKGLRCCYPITRPYKRTPCQVLFASGFPRSLKILWFLADDALRPHSHFGLPVYYNIIAVVAIYKGWLLRTVEYPVDRGCLHWCFFRRLTSCPLRRITWVKSMDTWLSEASRVWYRTWKLIDHSIDFQNIFERLSDMTSIIIHYLVNQSLRNLL